LSAEQFVGMCATSEGFNGILQALNLTKTELNELINNVKKHLPPDLAELLSKPATITPPLGVRKPRKFKKRNI